MGGYHKDLPFLNNSALHHRLIDLEHCALTAYRLLGCRDIARLDFRLDARGTPRFIECNPLPGLDPDNSDIVMLAAPSRSYISLVQNIFLTAAERSGVPLPASTSGQGLRVVRF